MEVKRQVCVVPGFIFKSLIYSPGKELLPVSRASLIEEQSFM